MENFRVKDMMGLRFKKYQLPFMVLFEYSVQLLQHKWGNPDEYW